MPEMTSDVDEAMVAVTMVVDAYGKVDAVVVVAMILPTYSGWVDVDTNDVPS